MSRHVASSGKPSQEPPTGCAKSIILNYFKEFNLILINFKILFLKLNLKGERT